MVKEHLEPNATADTLFVGVGGVGSGIVSMVADMCKVEETEFVRFVAMDTDVNSLKSVREDGPQVKLIQTSSTQTVGAYLQHDQSAYDKWFPNNTILYPKTVSEGAGQVRAISRLALNSIINNGEINKLYDTINELFLKDGRDMQQALRVCIVSTAAGGTGSGIAMIVGLMIRRYIKDKFPGRSVMIRAFVVMPSVLDTVIKTESERESLRCNGYATIKEINAFMMDGSGFCGDGVNPESGDRRLRRYRGLSVEVSDGHGNTVELTGLPFDFCFLMERTDRDHRLVNNLDKYKELAALCLYEQNIGPMQGKAFSQEDNVIKLLSIEDNLGRNRFGGLGASTLRYPYEQIAEYIACDQALKRIGGNASWTQYDNEYLERMTEYNKSRQGEKPERAAVYCEMLEGGSDDFSEDIRRQVGGADTDEFLEAAMMATSMFLDNYISEIEDFTGGEIARGTVTNVQKQIAKYKNVTEGSVKPSNDFAQLTKYKNELESVLEKCTKRRATAILVNEEPMQKMLKNTFTIENVFKTNTGALHPNAMRYLLYKLQTEVHAERVDAESEIRTKKESVEKYYAVPKDQNAKVFGDYPTFSAMCNAYEEERSKKDFATNYGNKLTSNMTGLTNDLTEYDKLIREHAAYEVLEAHLGKLSKEFELFYESFAKKVDELKKKQKAILDDLRFRPGDTVLNVCSTEEQLNELICNVESSGDHGLLPDDLSEKLYNSAKINLARRRRIANNPMSNNEDPIDIFDKVLYRYFLDSVHENHKKEINLDILKALVSDYTLTERAKARKLSLERGEEEFMFRNVERKYEKLAMQGTIDRVKRLSLPHVAMMFFGEPREVSLCAYNKELNDHTDYTVGDFVSNAVGTDTVSRYELRFFNATYNITPDKIAFFAAPNNAPTNQSEGGQYFRAYHNYVKDMGPTSTAGTVISPHIDRRWDSVAVMPEIDMAYHHEEMINIHKALIYGLLHEVLVKKLGSSADRAQSGSIRELFAYEDKIGIVHDLSVSNGTYCDEFYEILDALYRNRAAVATILDIAKKNGQDDREKSRSRFEDTRFYKALTELRISGCHDSKTSLFEIPLMYYNSLPSHLMDGNELGDLVDAVIDVLRDEINTYCAVIDRKPVLCRELKMQFDLFVANFQSDEKLQKNTTLNANPVADEVYKKVRMVFEDARVMDYEKVVDEMRDAIKNPKPVAKAAADDNGNGDDNIGE